VTELFLRRAIAGGGIRTNTRMCFGLSAADEIPARR